MRRWEYLRLDVRYKDSKDPGVHSVFLKYEENLSNLTFQELQNYLNQLGSEGWEMVGERGAGERLHAFYFKRPLGKAKKKEKKKKPSAPEALPETEA